MGQSSIVSTDLKIAFHFPVIELQASYIDLAQCLSIINRRSYRQGMNYAVSNIEFRSNIGGRVTVFTVPTTWVADNAITKAFEFWKDQRAEVLREQPSLKAKWSDFKVYMDDEHAFATTVANNTPIWYDPNNAYQPTSYLKGEWDASEIVFPVDGGAGGPAAANQQTMHVTGNNFPAGNFQTATGISFSLIEAYANSRRTPQSPDPSTTGVSVTSNPYATLASSDEKFQDIAENVLGRNDEPPYDLDDYPGGELNAGSPQFLDTAYLNNFGDTSSYSVDTISSFVAPMGLLKILPELNEGGTELTMFVTLVPGKYKGVLAERGV